MRERDPGWVAANQKLLPTDRWEAHFHLAVQAMSEENDEDIRYRSRLWPVI